MRAETPRARLVAGLLLLGLAALPACRSTGGGGSFITVPRAGAGSSSNLGPERSAEEPAEPDGPAAAAAASAGGGGGGSPARSDPRASAGADKAGKAAKKEEASSGKDSFELKRSSAAQRGRPQGEAAAGGDDRAPEGGTRPARDQKKEDIPVQDLTRRPFRLRQKPAGAGVLAAALPMASDLDAGAPAAAPDSETPPPLTQLDVDMTGGLELETMLVGAFLIQMSTSPGFTPVLFNKVYDFMEDADVFGDIAALELRKGYYWVRYAFLDLLGGQHPYSKPRRYAYRPPEKKPPEEPRKRKS